MSRGFIYVLTNDSYNGLIKIGKTAISSRERAKQLSSATGVPTPFRVAYEVYVDDCDKIERIIHSELSDFRVNSNREFFNYPLSKTIDLIQNTLSNEEETEENYYEAIEILERLKEKFGDYINENLTSVRIYQTQDRVYLETTIDKYIGEHLKDQYIVRTDLGFIIEDEYSDNMMFMACNEVNFNVEKFMLLDEYSIINCIDNLFNKWTEDEIGVNYSNNIKESC